MIATHYSPDAKAVVFTGDCLTFMREIPQESIQLVVSSPPYNIGKPYVRDTDSEGGGEQGPCAYFGECTAEHGTQRDHEVDQREHSESFV